MWDDAEGVEQSDEGHGRAILPVRRAQDKQCGAFTLELAVAVSNALQECALSGHGELSPSSATRVQSLAVQSSRWAPRTVQYRPQPGHHGRRRIAAPTSRRFVICMLASPLSVISGGSRSGAFTTAPATTARHRPLRGSRRRARCG